MLRGDNILCGTSTTSTGTLTLAAVPQPPGSLDFDTWLRAEGFANSAAVPISYTINEYTDATFATIKGTEKGVGLLTLGGSAGIANCTLVRTTSQYKVTGMDGASPAITYSSAYSIGTAANVLVTISPSAADVLACSPWYDNTQDAAGIGPLVAGTVTGAFTSANNTIYYAPYIFDRYILASKARARVQGAYTGGTSNLYAALYLPGSGGKPSKLVADFGALGTGGSALTSAGSIIASAALSTSVPIKPGIYIAAVQAIFSGGSGTPTIRGGGQLVLPPTFGTTSLAANQYATATGGSAAFADPAGVASWALVSNATPFFITFGP
jgi:hypothetical protein